MKTIININDDFISILLFKVIGNYPVILYENIIELTDNEIKMNYIVDNTSFANKLKQLLNQANAFMNQTINEVYLSFDINKIDIDDFSVSLNLPNRILNQKVWERINQIKIKQEVDKQILCLDTIKWNINGLNVYKLDKTYKGIDHVDIYGKLFLINKVLYTNIENIFANLNIKIIEFMPTLMNFNLLSKSNEFNNYELVIYLNKSSLIIVLLQANHIIKIYEFKLGIQALIDEIAKRTKIKNKQQIFSFLNYEDSIINNNVNNLAFILDYNHQCFNYIEHNISNINNIVKEYIDYINSSINEIIKELKLMDIHINFISLLTYNNINKYIFNKVKSNLNIDNEIINVNNQYNLSINQNFNAIYLNKILSRYNSQNNNSQSFNSYKSISSHQLANKGV